LIGESVARRSGRDLVEAAVFDADPRLLAHGLEDDLHFRMKIERETRLAPGENQPVRRLPDTDPPDLEHLAAGAGLDQPPALAGLKGEPPGPRRGLEQRTWPPPVADLAHEGREGPL